MAAELTENSIGKLFMDKFNASEVTLQITKLEETDKGFRGEVSDGKHCMVAKFASQLKSTFKDNDVEVNAIFTATTFSVDDIQGEKVFQAFEASGFIVQDEKVGKPVDIRKASNASVAAAKAVSHTNELAYQPIASLNPYQSSWTIKARVTKKGDMRTYKNARGEGKLFSVDLLDGQGGEIKATMFQEVADKLFTVFQEGQVYLIGRGSLKMANKKYSSINNDYEMSINMDSEVHLCGEDSSIKSQSYSFKSIEELPNIEPNEFVDIVGVVQKFGPVTQLVSQRTGRSLVKRNVTMLDSSLMVVEMTLWGDKAEEFSDDLLATFPIIAVKGVKVSEFGGRTLNSSFGTQFHVNPMGVPEADLLRVWYEDKGKDAQVQSISDQVGRGGGKTGDPRKELKDIDGERLGYGEKPDYFTVLGTIINLRADPKKPPYYPACPSEGCNKKVVQDESRGVWVCEKCDKSYAAPQYRYILSVQVSDASGDFYLSAFNEVAEILVGSTAEEVNNLLVQGKEKKFVSTIKGATLFKQLVFKCRATTQSGQDGETRVRCNVLTASPLNYGVENRSLLDEIATFEQGADSMVA